MEILPKQKFFMEMKPQLSDKARRDLFLISRAKEGDQRAYTELVNLYFQSLYHMVLRIVKHAEDAEDITFSAFEKAFINLDKYEEDYAFSTWLYKIASNHSIDFLRKKKLETVSLDQQLETTSGKSMDAAHPAGEADPEEAFIRTQRADIMKSVVSSLDESSRILVQLRYFKEYSYEEIASELQMPLGTVKVQLHRAKKLLYSRLISSRTSY